MSGPLLKGFRYFPYLAYGVFGSDIVDDFELDDSYEWKGLLFEWGTLAWLVFAKGKLKDKPSVN